jgi:hypothetical protein
MEERRYLRLTGVRQLEVLKSLNFRAAYDAGVTFVATAKR